MMMNKTWREKQDYKNAVYEKVDAIIYEKKYGYIDDIIAQQNEEKYGIKELLKKNLTEEYKMAVAQQVVDEYRRSLDDRFKYPPRCKREQGLFCKDQPLMPLNFEEIAEALERLTANTVVIIDRDEYNKLSETAKTYVKAIYTRTINEIRDRMFFENQKYNRRIEYAKKTLR